MQRGRIELGTCENCRFEAQLGDAPSFSGDRIYVMKNGLSLPWLKGAGRVDLKRWDVTVFKLPEEPEVRYIKRLVGMPNEVLRIEGGDLWVRPPHQSAEFERLRRPLDHQQAMQLTVYDDAHRAAALGDDPRWLRWASASTGGWMEPTPGQFVPGERSLDWTELRYHHLVPGPEQWKAIQAGVALQAPPRATLITDYNSYNTDLLAEDLKHPRRAARAWFQPHWVGDLTLSLRLTVREPVGQVRLELIKSGRIQSLRDRPLHRRGAALPCGFGSGPTCSYGNHSCGKLPAHFRQRRSATDPLGGWKPALGRRPDLRCPGVAAGTHRGRSRTGSDRRTTRRDSRRQAGSEA